jgi:hypothetical protein
MKAILVILLVLLAAATVVGYGRLDVAATVLLHTPEATEPAALLVSGSILLVVAGALRRLV